MANSLYQTPDLASVLNTLSQFAPPKQASPTTQHPPSAARDSIYPSTASASRGHTTAHVSSASRAPPPIATLATAATSSIDPSTILEWPAALRCVMRTVARNDAAIARIRQMIRVQHEHEKQWWAGRQALLKKQEARVEGRDKLNSVLLSIGGHSRPTTAETTVDEDTRELATYATKVYKASIEMAQAMVQELESTGVPFFGVREDLIQNEVDPLHVRRKDGPVKESTRDGSRTGIDRGELVQLQRRMLELLEDMCRD